VGLEDRDEFFVRGGNNALKDEQRKKSKLPIGGMNFSFKYDSGRRGRRKSRSTSKKIGKKKTYFDFLDDLRRSRPHRRVCRPTPGHQGCEIRRAIRKDGRTYSLEYVLFHVRSKRVVIERVFPGIKFPEHDSEGIYIGRRSVRISTYNLFGSNLSTKI
jgi:hypothetical protein